MESSKLDFIRIIFKLSKRMGRTGIPVVEKDLIENQ
jgi:hypothetical protein